MANRVGRVQMSLSRPQHHTSVPLDKIAMARRVYKKRARDQHRSVSNESLPQLNMNFLPLFAVLLLLGCAALGSGAAVGKPTGQPGCQTEEELAVQNYAHFYLKSSYWTCEALGVPATLNACGIAQAWFDVAKSCVPWPQWYWTPTVQPPSEPLPVA